MWESKFCLHTYVRNKILIRNNSGVQRKVHTTYIQYKYRTNNMFFLVRYVHVAFTNDEKLMVPVRYGTVPYRTKNYYTRIKGWNTTVPYVLTYLRTYRTSRFFFAFLSLTSFILYVRMYVRTDLSTLRIYHILHVEF